MTPQEEAARIQALIDRGRRLQADASGETSAGQKAFREREAAAKAGHAAWVRRQNERKTPEWRARELANLRRTEEEKRKIWEEEQQEERKIEEYRQKLKKGRA